MAKDSDVSLGSRATATKNTIVDKKNEKSHNVQANANKSNTSHLLIVLRVPLMIPEWVADTGNRICEALNNVGI